MSDTMTAAARLERLFDNGVFTLLDARVEAGVTTAFGEAAGSPCYAFVQTGEAVTETQGAKIRRVFQLAMKTGAPVVGMYDSKGAKLSEGQAVLNAFGDLLLEANRLSGMVPQISVIMGTCGGCAALLAQTADLTIMGPGGELFVTPPFNLGKTAAFSGSASNAKAGAVQITVGSEEEGIDAARKALSLLPSNNLSAAPHCEFSEPELTEDLLASAVDPGSELELYEAFGQAATTALASIGGVPCGVAGVKGALNRESCVKLARFVRLCDAFSLPVVTLVDSEGFEASSEAEATGAVREAAMLTNAYGEATTAKISVVTGKAVGPVYVALAGRGANADCVFAIEGSVISPLPTAAAVSVLFDERIAAGEDRAALEAEYDATIASAAAAAEAGVVDDVILPQDLRARLIAAMEMLSGKRVSTVAKKHSNMPL